MYMMLPKFVWGEAFAAFSVAERGAAQTRGRRRRCFGFTGESVAHFGWDDEKKISAINVA